MINFQDSIDNIISQLNLAMLNALDDAFINFPISIDKWERVPQFVKISDKIHFKAGYYIQALSKKEDYEFNKVNDDTALYNGYENGKFLGPRNYTRKQVSEEVPFTYWHIFYPIFDTNDILNLLGFEEFKHSAFGWDKMQLIAQQSFTDNVAESIFLMYVFTDIIRDHPVGGDNQPLLRAVPLTSGIYEGIGYCTFENRIYYPVRKNLIDSIAIMLTHDNGDRVKFAPGGRVFISLDFQKKKKIVYRD